MEEVMLCQEGNLKDLRRHGYACETKWDGTRVKVVKENGQVTLVNRHRIIYTSRLPELIEAAKAIKGDFTLDGEVVWINPVTGLTEFTPCQCLLGKTHILEYGLPVTRRKFNRLAVT